MTVTVSTVLAALAESEQHYAAAVDALADMCESLAMVKSHLDTMQRQAAKPKHTIEALKDWRRTAARAVR